MIQRLISWPLVLLGIWLLLVGPNTASWVIATPAIGLGWAAALSLAPATPSVIRPIAALSFLPYFLFHSLRGGWDVSIRAFRRDLPLNPARVTYLCRLPQGSSRLVFANLVSLLPGTLFLSDRGETLEIHTIDRDQPLQDELTTLERRVARLFGLKEE